MCYLVYLATTSDADLSSTGSERLAFERVAGGIPEPAARLLSLPRRWYVSWMGGCSCGLRHATTPDLGFGEPEEWYPEDEEAVDNTRLLYDVIDRLVRSGHAVECLDVWTGTPPERVEAMDVDLGTVPGEDFRLFENHLFRFATPTTAG